jgi:hypothetical protein
LVDPGTAGACVGFADGNHYPFAQVGFDAAPVNPNQRQRYPRNPGQGPGGITQGSEPAGPGARGGRGCVVSHRTRVVEHGPGTS